MSFQKAFHEVSVNRNELLDLFLGLGELKIDLGDQIVTVEELNDRHVKRVEDVVRLHEVNIRGTSNHPAVSYVNGKCLIKPLDNNETFILGLELHLQDRFD